MLICVCVQGRMRHERFSTRWTWHGHCFVFFPKEQLNRINPKIIAEFYARKAMKKATAGGENVVRQEDKLVDA